jgi:hypothetical protein
MSESSWIARIEHDGKALHVYTKTGKHYVHSGVSKEKFEAMQKASSLGGFFNQHIRVAHPGRLA